MEIFEQWTEVVSLTLLFCALNARSRFFVLNKVVSSVTMLKTCNCLIALLKFDLNTVVTSHTTFSNKKCKHTSKLIRH